MEAVSQEVYEQVKAQVLAEVKEEQRKRQRECERTRMAAWHMFDELRAKYLPKLITNVIKFYPNRTDHLRIAHEKFDHITQMAISAVGERDAKHAYRNGKAEEAVRTADKMLSELYDPNKE